MFQFTWLLLIVGSQSHFYWLAIPLIVFFFAFELRHDAPAPQQYWLRLLIALSGCLADSIFSGQQLIQFSSDNELIPAWLVLMWILFALAFSSCYRWLVGKPTLAISFAMIFGPGAYWGATRLTNVEILEPLYFTLWSSVFWGSLFAIIFLNKKIAAILFSFSKSESNSEDSIIASLSIRADSEG